MTGISLRRAVATDAKPIRRCIEAAYAAARQSIPDLPDVTEGVEEDIRDRNVVVAVDETSLHGVVVFGFERETAMIFNLAVSPDAQGRGIARRLLNFVATEARENGVRNMRLTTHRLMADTRAMYRHLGWQETGHEGNKVYFSKPT
ncbi:GNAT family N-acetyltransferase [Ruegeria arenilitoris]|uniref:GNAT family N-acetyltransferase n=1 Tax=Ruegeria arenilitoris TaxID=1173585 RepID=UPI00147BECCE|nr:GNAT family N-acetyltransferase [Ruegeria arenilitoris]